MRRVLWAFRPFAPLWTTLFLLTVVLTFGLGGGSGQVTLGIRILLIAVVLTSLVVSVAVEAWRWLRSAR